MDVTALYERHSLDVLAFLRKRMTWASTPEVEDMASLIWEKALRAADRYEDRGPHYQQAWVYQIARNAVIDEVRRRSVVVMLPLIDMPGGRATLDAGCGRHDDVLDVRAAVQRLSKRDAYFVRAYYLDGQLDREIGAACGMERVAVRKQRERSLERLRRHMENTTCDV